MEQAHNPACLMQAGMAVSEPIYCRFHPRGAGSVLLVACAPSHDEGMILSGWSGSGRIQLARRDDNPDSCPLAWNDAAAQTEANSERLVEAMLSLQNHGCHNILLRSPGPPAMALIEALFMVRKRGLQVPIIYHGQGAECLESLQLLNGLVDIYIYDAHGGMSDSSLHKEEACRLDHGVIREMHRQVGDLVFDANGLVHKGLLVRHAVLPHGLACTKRLLAFLAHEITPRTYLTLTSGGTGNEAGNRAYQVALRLASHLGLKRSDAHWRLAHLGRLASHEACHLNRLVGFPGRNG